MKKKKPIKKIPIYNRETKTLEEEAVFEEKLLTRFYHTKWGLIFTRSLFTRKFISQIYGLYCRSAFSKRRIYQVIHRYDFRLQDSNIPLHDYKSFNDFFTRKLDPNARPICKNKNALISPADAKLVVHPIQDGRVISVKMRPYTIPELLKNQALAKEYENGLCLIFRLAPMDYHRFHYIDDGTKDETVEIEGKYHSVHPFALELDIPIFPENKRHYTLLHTKNFGDVVFMEVGAMMVGRIQQHHPKGTTFQKGQEKGLFEFGGSTIILLIKENQVQLDADIKDASQKQIETIVRMGEKIGERKGGD